MLTPIDDTLAGGGELGALIRALDWARTPLGPVESWPQSLRTSVSIVLASRFPLSIWWGDEYVLLYNDAYAPLLGAKHPAALGQPALDVWAEVKEILGPMLAHVSATGETTVTVNGLLPLHRHGFLEECYFTWSYSPIRVESGRVGGILTVVTETSEQVLGARRRHLLRELATATAGATGVDAACRAAAHSFQPDVIPFSLLYLQEDGCTTARLVATSGIEPGQPASPRLLDSASPTASPSHAIWPLAQAHATGALQQVCVLDAKFAALPTGGWPAPTREAIVLPISRPNEARPFGFLVAGVHPGHPLHASHRRFFDLVGTQLSLALSFARASEATEPSDELRARQSALSLMQQVTRDDQRKNEFLAMLAHELRNPLAALSGALQLIGHQEPRDEREQRYREICRRQVTTLVRLVDDLLDISRITRGRVELRREQTDLVAVVNAALQVTRPQFDQRRHQVTLSVGAGSFVFAADPIRLEQVFTNLLTNAAMYTDIPGQIDIRLTRSGDARGAWARVTISDPGRGLAPEMLEGVFELFAQVDRGLARSDSGLGIGLTLARGLVEQHGGRIEAHSEGRGRGTTMTVHLPLTAAAQLPQSAATSGHAASATAGAARRRIVLVEDNDDARLVLHELLADLGHEVSVAPDGSRGRDLILAARPDLALVDIGLPDIDGYEVARAVRREPTLAATTLVALTGYGDAESRARAHAAGFDAHLTKPVNLKQLEQVLRR